jgi:hypothetical protein
MYVINMPTNIDPTAAGTMSAIKALRFAFSQLCSQLADEHLAQLRL